MTTKATQRLDEVAEHYRPAEIVERVCAILFWCNAAIAFGLLFSERYLPPWGQSVLTTGFVIGVFVYFCGSLVLRFWLVPRAEGVRRRQFLSNALGVNLAEEQTANYYNNEFGPSTLRIAANTLENALFTKEITGKMLLWRRAKIAAFFILWVVLVRCASWEILIWMTQLVFSIEVGAEWVNLEMLHHRCESIYHRLYDHFAGGRGHKTPHDAAVIVDAFASYECAKAAAGTLLSSRIFRKLNPSLSDRWDTIRKKLQMDR